MKSGKISFEEARVSKGRNVGDLLIDRGWLLIHNPSQSKIVITRSTLKQLTNKQKDFLYVFLCKHGMNKEANELYQ